jgi:hypothetical protein
MYAQAGEIVDAWIETDEKDMNTILNRNRFKQDTYWVVLFENVIPGKNIKYNGGTPIVRVLKDFPTKPRPMVGAHIAEVDNKRGKIIWRSYPKDIPVDWKQVTDEELTNRKLIYECDIPKSYIYNKP